MIRLRYVYLMLAVFMVILIVDGCIYFFSTKSIIERQMVNESNLVSNDLQNAFKRTQDTKVLVEEQMAIQLRSDSLAILARIDHDYHNVTNAELENLSKELGCKITLMARPATGEDIVGFRSSEAEEVGLKATKKWGYWFDAFNQMLDGKIVSVGKGNLLDHFWAGPMSYAQTDGKTAYKFGYYYDGTTNYLINPFRSDQVFKEFDDIAGQEEIINSFMKKTPTVIELTGIIPKYFNTEYDLHTAEDGTKYRSFFEKGVYFGSYKYENAKKDAEIAQLAMKTRNSQSYRQIINGRDIFKVFIPVVTTTNNYSNPAYVVSMVYDYKEVTNQLHQRIFHSTIIILFALVVSAFILIMVNRIIGRTKEDAVRTTQEEYIGQMNKLFVIIRGQRHDINNHIQILYALMKTKKLDEMQRYMEEYVGEAIFINELVHINNPVVAAQVQAKMAIAETKGIKLNVECSDLNSFEVSAVKSIDIVKIIGNLVDNAIDEVENTKSNKRYIKLDIIPDQEKRLNIIVTNPIINGLKEEHLSKIFEHEYSTKKTKGHSGLGLSIIRERIEFYKGMITATIIDGELKIHAVLPL